MPHIHSFIKKNNKNITTTGNKTRYTIDNKIKEYINNNKFISFRIKITKNFFETVAFN